MFKHKCLILRIITCMKRAADTSLYLKVDLLQNVIKIHINNILKIGIKKKKRTISKWERRMVGKTSISCNHHSSTCTTSIQFTIPNALKSFSTPSVNFFLCLLRGLSLSSCDNIEY